jgi:hypothetical protein
METIASVESFTVMGEYTQLTPGSMSTEKQQTQGFASLSREIVDSVNKVNAQANDVKDLQREARYVRKILRCVKPNLTPGQSTNMGQPFDITPRV